MIDVEKLYQRYGGMVRARLARFFPEHELDDMLQEVFMRVIDKQHTFRGDSAASTWLYQLTTRHALNKLQQGRRRQELWVHTQDLSWAMPISASSQESKALLQELWKKLDEDLVMVGIYYHLDGMSQNDIASLMGCSRQTVGNRLRELTEAAKTLGGQP